MSSQGNIRGVGLQATALVREMVQRHKLKGEAARSLGEAVMGALLVASYCKQGERVNLNIRGSGRIQQALVDAHPDGTVRGYVVEREGASTQDYPAGLGPWGEGLMSILRAKDGHSGESEQPYIGTVPLVTGHLAKDLTFYWAQSEQIPSAVGLAVTLQGDEVVAAGGFLVQVLPGATPAEVQSVETHIQGIQSLADEVSLDKTPIHLISQIFQDAAFAIVEEKPLEFKCTCSRERAERALRLVGVDELKSLLQEEGAASVHCDFCATTYKIDGEHLKAMIQASH